MGAGTDDSTQPIGVLQTTLLLWHGGEAALNLECGVRCEIRVAVVVLQGRQGNSTSEAKARLDHDNVPRPFSLDDAVAIVEGTNGTAIVYDTFNSRGRWHGN